MFIEFTSCDDVMKRLGEAAPVDSLWLLCVADCHADLLPALLDRLHQKKMRACGGLFPGLIHCGSALNSGLIAIPLPAASLAVLADLTPEGLKWQNPLPLPAHGKPFSSFVFVDCLAQNIARVLEEIYDQYGNAMSYVGAGTGFHDLRRAPSIFTEQGLRSDAALLVLTPGSSTVRVRHGWTRVLGPFVATSTHRNFIKELNWEPAGSFYRRQVELKNPALAGRPVFPDLNSTYPLCIAKEGGEDVMRDPMSINGADEIEVLSDVTENSVMYLAQGDRRTTIDAARQAVSDLGSPQDVERCFISDCFSRALMLGDEFTVELKAVQEDLANFTGVAPEGVLALGEIAANGAQQLEFFNKTFVIAVTHRCDNE